MSAAAAASFSSVRPAIVTTAPSAASRCAVPSPIPLPPPVTRADRPRSALTCSRVGDGDCLLGADARRFLTLLAQRVRRFLLQDVEEVVVTHLEHLGRDAHAQGVAFALVEVDDDPETHFVLPVRAAALTAP